MPEFVYFKKKCNFELKNIFMIIFHLKDYFYLAESISKNLQIPLGTIEEKVFPDGEIYHCLEQSVLGQHVILVGGTHNDLCTLNLYDLGYGIVKAGARSLTLVIPYFGYSTMERAVKEGEIVKAKTRAKILSAIPDSPEGNKVLLLDLHSEGIPHYFGEHITATHLYGKKVIIQAIQDLANGKPFILASTDAGRAKWVASLANDLNVEAAFVYKTRLSGSQTKVTGVNADVKNKTVIIYDDMIRTGGSLLQAAQSYLEAGAKEVFAVATHLVLPNASIDKLKNSNLITKICGTNSHPRSLELQSDFLHVYDISSIFAEFLKNYFFSKG